MIRSLWSLALLLAGCSLFNQDLPNEPPKLEVSTADTLRVARGGRVTFEVSASDKDDDPLGYGWSAPGIPCENEGSRTLQPGCFSDSTSRTTVWRAPERISGASEFFLVTVIITDHQPDTEDVLENFLVEVVQNIPLLSVSADTVVSFREQEILLTAVGSDADGDALTFAWEFIEGERVEVATHQPTPESLQVTLTPLIPTTVRLLISLTDGSDTLRQEINVEIEADVPDGGTVTLQRPLFDGSVVSYEMDVYEYPNQLGETPHLAANFFEALTLCEAKNMRLCSVPEWINACAGPQGLLYSSTDSPEIGIDGIPEAFGLRFCNTPGSDLAGDDPQFGDVYPSGSFPNCSHPDVGVYDLTGNSFEWLMDITLDGRVGAFQLTATGSFGECDNVSSMSPIPFAGELDVSDPAVVDSLLSLPNAASSFGQSIFGFRCCR